mgnify:CR=1 FL=1
MNRLPVFGILLIALAIGWVIWMLRWPAAGPAESSLTVIVLPTLIPIPTLEPTGTPRIVPERILVITTRLPTPTFTVIPSRTPEPTGTRVPQTPVQKGQP